MIKDRQQDTVEDPHPKVGGESGPWYCNVSNNTCMTGLQICFGQIKFGISIVQIPITQGFVRWVSEESFLLMTCLR